LERSGNPDLAENQTGKKTTKITKNTKKDVSRKTLKAFVNFVSFVVKNISQQNAQISFLGD